MQPAIYNHRRLFELPIPEDIQFEEVVLDQNLDNDHNNDQFAEANQSEGEEDHVEPNPLEEQNPVENQMVYMANDDVDNDIQPGVEPNRLEEQHPEQNQMVQMANDEELYEEDNGMQPGVEPNHDMKFEIMPIRRLSVVDISNLFRGTEKTTLMIDEHETMSFEGEFPMPKQETIDARFIKREGDKISGCRPFFETVSIVEFD